MSTAIANVRETQWPRSFARRSAAVGFIVWVSLLLSVTTDSHETELIHKIVFFAMLVIVPLALSLVPARDEQGNAGLYRAVVMVQPIAVAVTIASFFFEKGVVSASLSAAWLIVSALVALFGLTRLLARGVLLVQEVSIDAGLLYLPVAGMWLVIYRFGVQPFDYGETIILLTVIHFHFAGFAAPIIVGMVGRMLLATDRPGRIFSAVVVSVVAAMPLIAAGITFSPWLGLIGTLLLSTGLVILAVLTLSKVLPAITSRRARVLLLLASLSSCAAMVLACLYAYSIVARILILRIPTMAMTHGLLNAFGFTACSLLAWSIITRVDARLR